MEILIIRVFVFNFLLFINYEFISNVFSNENVFCNMKMIINIRLNKGIVF